MARMLKETVIAGIGLLVLPVVLGEIRKGLDKVEGVLTRPLVDKLGLALVDVEDSFGIVKGLVEIGENMAARSIDFVAAKVGFDAGFEKKTTIARERQAELEWYAREAETASLYDSPGRMWTDSTGAGRFTGFD